LANTLGKPLHYYLAKSFPNASTMACPSSIGAGPYSASTASFEGSASAGARVSIILPICAAPATRSHTARVLGPQSPLSPRLQTLSMGGARQLRSSVGNIGPLACLGGSL
jgi:hypothetical protein